MTLKLGGSFETFNDPQGNPLIALNRDGTILTQGVDFGDGSKQTTGLSGGAISPTSITNGNAGSFYLPINQNSTAPLGIVILDAPGGYITIQADAGAGSNIGGQLSLFSTSNVNVPASGFNLLAGGDIIQGGASTPGVSITASTGPLLLHNGSTQDILITHGGGTNGAKLDWGDNTLKPVGTGHVAADKTLAYTVGTLPTGFEGQLAYATNGRKVGEGPGVGTGVPVYFSNAQWRVFSTDAQVQA